MAQIYRCASRVLICLDADDGGHAPRASTILSRTSERIQRIASTIDSPAWDIFPRTNLGDDLHDAQWTSLVVLLSQDWFSRGWVIREAALARTATVIWGMTHFAWEQLMQTLVWQARRNFSKKVVTIAQLHPLAHVHAYETQNPQFARMFYEKADWDPSSLLGYLNCGRGLGLTDARDRIYAFLDMAADSNPVKILPDYSASPLEIYWSFALEYLSSTGDMSLLDYIIHNEGTLVSGLPSWIPCWEKQNHHFPSTFNDPWRSCKTSGSGRISVPRLVGRDVLKVEGACFDTIAAASDALNYATTTKSTFVEAWQSISSVRKKLVYDYPYHLAAYVSVLSRGMSPVHRSSWEHMLCDYANDLQYAVDRGNEKTTPASMSDPSNDTTDVTFQSLRIISHNYRLIVTQRGYLGLAPAVAAVGDICAVIFGSKTTCILRETDRSQHYTYLGSSYMLGSRKSDELLAYGHEFGSEQSKDWVHWDVGEHNIFLS
ncbi:hypothetical protein E8E12_004322 [Didymella heteroderae]|uniref:Heterokaryon incompatibility domain-containing protein n=1 Tax=Didymella heteroderae TaxID=1769908 RepID=A0A9P5C0U8_9PLEO|nr:hypothetical protein E8E12_004322 [Didymella heteroderae]